MTQSEFVKLYGEDAISKAFETYHKQRQRSASWREGSQKKAKAFDQLLSRAGTDPKLKELLKTHGVTV